MTETTQAVEATDEDRKAAADLHAAQTGMVTSYTVEIHQGRRDYCIEVQTLARHRINTIEQCAKVAERWPTWSARHIAFAIRNLARKEQG